MNKRRETMFRAIQNGELKTVLSLLNEGMDVNTDDGEDSTLLHKAVEAGQTDIVRLLLWRGANVHAHDFYDTVPLHAAAWQEDPTILNLLLAYGADPNRVWEGEDKPLHSAARCGRVRNMEILLAHGAKLEAKGFERETALTVAATEGHQPAVRFLLERGANVHAQDGSGETALDAAAISQQPDIVRLLLEYGSRQAPAAEADWFRLAQSAINGREEEFEAVLATGHALNVRDTAGHTVLLLAAEMGFTDACARLLNHGADQRIASQYGHTPLSEALRNGHEAVIRLLLTQEAGRDMLNALLYAAASGQDEACVEQLLHYGADVNALHGGVDESALFHWTEERGALRIGELLLAAGANPNLGDVYERSPLHMAACQGDLERAGILLRAGANVNAMEENGSSVLDFSLPHAPDMAEFLLQHGADINAMAENGNWSCLHIAVSMEDTQQVRWLLAHGADPTRCCPGSGLSPLKLAEQRGNAELISLLKHPHLS